MSADRITDAYDVYVRWRSKREGRLKLEKNFEDEVKCDKESEMKKEEIEARTKIRVTQPAMIKKVLDLIKNEAKFVLDPKFVEELERLKTPDIEQRYVIQMDAILR